ncbi:hypothetical protein SCP_0600820 [Sparassis crispa]|uniref:Uncharacterized protein n=1 Tax=Sparassis crispa TaxID=139825 RepID=A0A401GQX3_9APHY|nr:hypothetical protein SCP_0600820 [Sparassis crispa]GBE84104.1 hypothetical protein SCP_0600820 [Sparassis crispa]
MKTSAVCPAGTALKPSGKCVLRDRSKSHEVVAVTSCDQPREFGLYAILSELNQTWSQASTVPSGRIEAFRTYSNIKSLTLAIVRAPATSRDLLRPAPLTPPLPLSPSPPLPLLLPPPLPLLLPPPLPLLLPPLLPPPPLPPPLLVPPPSQLRTPARTRMPTPLPAHVPAPAH